MCGHLIALGRQNYKIYRLRKNYAERIVARVMKGSEQPQVHCLANMAAGCWRSTFRRAKKCLASGRLEAGDINNHSWPPHTYDSKIDNRHLRAQIFQLLAPWSTYISSYTVEGWAGRRQGGVGLAVRPFTQQEIAALLSIDYLLCKSFSRCYKNFCLERVFSSPNEIQILFFFTAFFPWIDGAPC